MGGCPTTLPGDKLTRAGDLLLPYLTGVISMGYLRGAAFYSRASWWVSFIC